MSEMYRKEAECKRLKTEIQNAECAGFHFFERELLEKKMILKKRETEIISLKSEFLGCLNRMAKLCRFALNVKTEEDFQYLLRFIENHMIMKLLISPALEELYVEGKLEKQRDGN